MGNIWRGWIIDESLKDIAVLSKLKVIKSIIEENIEGDEKRVWKLYTVEFENKNIDKFSKILEKNVRPKYYVHFTNGKELLIIFSGKSFRIRLEKVGKEDEYGIFKFRAQSDDLKIWKSAFEYGTTKGKVDSRYLVNVE